MTGKKPTEKPWVFLEDADGKISVIIPTYNRAKELKRSVESVLAQTYDNFELIIVDDGSKDNTQEVIASIPDERIRYIKLDKTEGPQVRETRESGPQNAI